MKKNNIETPFSKFQYNYLVQQRHQNLVCLKNEKKLDPICCYIVQAQYYCTLISMPLIFHSPIVDIQIPMSYRANTTQGPQLNFFGESLSIYTSNVGMFDEALCPRWQHSSQKVNLESCPWTHYQGWGLNLGLFKSKDITWLNLLL